jgi:hypothetical protein
MIPDAHVRSSREAGRVLPIREACLDKGPRRVTTKSERENLLTAEPVLHR